MIKDANQLDTAVSQEDIDGAILYADKITEQIVEDQEDHDPVLVMFALFCNAIHILNQHGWSTRELVNEVFDHTHDTDEYHGETLQ